MWTQSQSSLKILVEPGQHQEFQNTGSMLLEGVGEY